MPRNFIDTNNCDIYCKSQTTNENNLKLKQELKKTSIQTFSSNFSSFLSYFHHTHLSTVSDRRGERRLLPVPGFLCYRQAGSRPADRQDH